jgi:hypothetical protein
MTTYTCLFFMGLVRIVLEIFPYQFHTLNHRVLACILLPLIFCFSMGEVFLQVTTCGYACDSTVNSFLFGLYKENMDLKTCSSFYFRPSVVCALSITYLVILSLEYKRRKVMIQPSGLVDQHWLQPQRNRVPNEEVYFVSGRMEERNTPPCQVSVYILRVRTRTTLILFSHLGIIHCKFTHHENFNHLLLLVKFTIC